jgi:hypothetical protein
MGIDHSDAFVRLSFSGLIAFCFSKREDSRCEMGMVQADDHEPLLRIIRRNPNGSTTIVPTPPLDRLKPILIVAKRPVEIGATTFPQTQDASVFDRISGRGDPEDFRWITDLQGEDFHGAELKLKRGGGEETRLRPKIIIPRATFYTLEKTEYQYRRVKFKGNTPDQPIGRIANFVGADIKCLPAPQNDPELEPGQKLVTVTIGDDEPIKLFRNTDQGKGFRYVIEFSNVCRRPEVSGAHCPERSDFPLYYKVAEDNDGIQFDLSDMHDPSDLIGTHPIPAFFPESTSFPQFVGFRANGSPEVCAPTFLSRTNSIP